MPSGSSLTDYIKSGWVTGLDESSIRPITINGLPAATARASADRWQFDIVVIGANNKVYRFLTAAPKGSNTLLPASQTVTQSFRLLSPAEQEAIKPLRIRVVTVKPGDTMASLSARMQGTTRKLELFRLLNAMSAGATVSVGDRVKLISE